MSALKTVLLELKQDEDGAAFLEYTVLLGIILAVSIGVILSIGTWAGSVWTLLCNDLMTAAIGTVPTACT